MQLLLHARNEPSSRARSYRSSKALGGWRRLWKAWVRGRGSHPWWLGPSPWPRWITQLKQWPSPRQMRPDSSLPVPKAGPVILTPATPGEISDVPPQPKPFQDRQCGGWCPLCRQQRCWKQLLHQSGCICWQCYVGSQAASRGNADMGAQQHLTCGICAQAGTVKECEGCCTRVCRQCDCWTHAGCRFCDDCCVRLQEQMQPSSSVPVPEAAPVILFPWPQRLASLMEPQRTVNYLAERAYWLRRRPPPPIPPPGAPPAGACLSSGASSEAAQWPPP